MRGETQHSIKHAGNRIPSGISASIRIHFHVLMDQVAIIRVSHGKLSALRHLMDVVLREVSRNLFLNFFFFHCV